MRKLIPALLISIFLLLSLALLLAGTTLAQAPDPSPAKGVEPRPNLEPTPTVLQIDRALLPKIEPQLLKQLLEDEREPAPFIVYLKGKTDLAAAVAATSAAVNTQTKPDRLARRSAIVNALQQTAGKTQVDVLQTLRTPPPGTVSQLNAGATNIRPLWIINAVAARGTLATVLAVAARPEVEVIRLDREIQLTHPSASGEDFTFYPIFPCSSTRPRSCPLPILSQSVMPNLQSVEWGIAKIRADLVHNALGIDGTGVIVANIDTGVDWLHPALQAKYRGHTGAGHLPLHVGNWFDATDGGATYPVDGNGHGTHTMGTMVGDNGIGVAPGAQWIAVRAFDSAGAGQNSWLHTAFQWVLAPNGDPALAPDIVNNSWGSDFGASTEFEADVQVLLDAGIFPVFSAGNNGPSPATIGSPGSYDFSFAVGATTIDDEVTNFSSRGPSPWGKIKPEVSAPGKDIRSTLPGGAYGVRDGTSMAAPHASGLVALLFQASPTLANDLSSLANTMTSTVVQLGSSIPNNDYGWGRLDAYNAVMSVASAGIMQGNVTQAGGGLPIGNAAIQIARRSTPGTFVNTTTDVNGTYLQGLSGGNYDVTASAFGYESTSASNVLVTTGTTTIQNFGLQSRPKGTLQGTVNEVGSGAPLVATISIDGTPANTTSDSSGNYSLNLPTGMYTVTVVATRHRVTKAVNVTIDEEAVVTRNFQLDPSPGILLVDSGTWYQESQIGFYEQALDDLRYPYHTWHINAPFEPRRDDIPTAADLADYDIVIWSSPLDSPGYIGADTALESFLDGGGRLLLSGQDVAYYDGGGSVVGSAPYLREYLKTSFVQDKSGIFTTTGVSNEPFDGLFLTLTDGDGADNQVAPDVVAIADPDFAGPLLTYDEDNLAGLHIGLCTPYRAVFLPFGFEGINSRVDRNEVLERAINWLMQAPAEVGVELAPINEMRIGNFGTNVTHTVRVRNTGTNDDTYELSYGSNWPITAMPAGNISLTTCQTQVVTIGVTLNTSSWHFSDTLTISAESINHPTVRDTAIRVTKSPAPVLLVDDDRWFSFAAEYREALEANNIPYDYWLVPKSWVGPVPPSPPLETLQLYPTTVWYTAYDWFQPLTPEEENRLISYLDGGGRLLFSSQDYIYNLPDHQPGLFAHDYLGVLDHVEDFSSTLTIGESGNPVGDQLGPYALTFPPGYNNWTDALTPIATAHIASRGHADQPNGLTHAGTGPGGENWHTNFMAYGLELLSSPDRARLMQRSLGWLSWLGRSTVIPGSPDVREGAVVTYTATILNDGWKNLPTAYFTATRPAELTWGTFSAELREAGDNLVWIGPLPKNESKVFTYTATVTDSLPSGTIIGQTSWLAYPEHNILFDRIASVHVNFPDLSNSTMGVSPNRDVKAGDVLNYTITLKNDGLADAPMVTATNTLPHMLDLVSVDFPSQGTVVSGENSITWTTSLSKGEAATLSYQAVISYRTGSAVNNTAYANDRFNDLVELTARATYKILPIYLPIISKN